MFNNKDNGLFKTALGNSNFAEKTNEFSSKGKEIKEIRIPNCKVIGIGGISSFQKKDYSDSDSGSLLVDLKLPAGNNLSHNGELFSGVKNIRCKQEIAICELANGLLEEDFLYDEYGRQRTGTLVLKSNLNYNKAVYEGYFEFEKPTKSFSSSMGYNKEKSTLYGEKSSPTFSVLYGNSSKSAFNNYKELYKYDLDKGDYYG